MRRILIAFLFSCFVSSSFAQPNLEWAIACGSAGYDFGNAIGVDAQGNTYTTGFYNGTVDFDPGAGTYNQSCVGGLDMYLLKTDSSGNFVWAQSYGGTGYVEAGALKINANGEILITGFFSGIVDFNLGPGVDTLRNADDPCNTETFILKLDNNGAFIWVKSIEGVVEWCTSNTDEGFSLDFDQNENIYVGGSFMGSADFDVSTAPGDTFMVHTAGSTFEYDLFVLSLDPSGNFRWVHTINFTLAYGLHVDDFGHVYVTGLFGGGGAGFVDFNSGPGVDIVESHGSWDAFLMKLDTAGNYIYSKVIGSFSDDRGLSVTTDAVGNVYGTGEIYGVVDFDVSASTANIPNPQRAIYVWKLDSVGNYVWAKVFGGQAGGYRQGKSITVDNQQNIYIGGFFTDTVDFNPSLVPGDTFFLSAPNGPFNADAFVAKLDSAGNFIWAISAGSTDEDQVHSVFVDAANKIYVTGFFGGPADFDPGAGTYSLGGPTTRDIFVQKLDQSVPNAIHESDQQSAFSVFPNPTENSVQLQSNTVSGTEARIVVSDVTGKTLSEQTVKIENGNMNAVVDLSTFPEGVYFITLTSAHGTVTKKITRL